ncbi:pyruvate formate-lyase-activating protein [Marinicrinis lubricantis]|uniref:Pyruvate formate-lyase-activating enzyme n=1 Tax=Marinicrinis lubricantis TaxID=2086470 RepID=A0ABW1IUD1_9BACL
MKGRIHSIETFGTVDGPGIRFVLFMQGCALRCRYCHNPDTWDTACGKTMTVEEVLAEMEPYLNYYKLSGGGITVTGGEPTLQASFVAELFQACKERFGVHTTLDSNGFCDTGHIEKLMKYTDLTLLDIKHMDDQKHIELTFQSNERTLKTSRYLSDHGHRMWIRHVLVPGWTDEQDDLIRLGQWIGSLNGVEKVELLPYHQMGVYKWGQLGRPYTLGDVEPPAREDVERARMWIEQGMNKPISVTI